MLFLWADFLSEAGVAAYFLLGIVWAYEVEIRKTKGFWVRCGFALYIPFVAAVLLVNRSYKI